jgi:O-antigen/teichoic acid export membrane protein
VPDTTEGDVCLPSVGLSLRPGSQTFKRPLGNGHRSPDERSCLYLGEGPGLLPPWRGHRAARRLKPHLHDPYPGWRASYSRRPRRLTGMSATWLRDRWPRRGSAAARASTTMIDQGVASASNFIVGIVVARISGPAGLGAFALAYMVWILLTMLYRATITEPMVILGDMRRDDKDETVRRGFAAVVTFGAMTACLTAAIGTTCLVVGQHTFGVGLLSVAPWVLVLVLQDYWRMIGFMESTPKKSLHNDLVFNAVQAMAFGVILAVGLHSVFAVISAWGLGAAVASLYGLWQFSVRPTFRGGGAFLRSRWSTSRWLASERVVNWGSAQLNLIVAGALLGPAALGGLKAAQGLVTGPTNVVLNASGSFGLPEASRRFADRGWAGMARVSRLMTTGVVLAAAATGVVVLVFAPTLIRLLYGNEFVAYASCARIFAVSLTIYAFGIGPILNLTTTRQVRSLFVLQTARLAFSVAAVCVLARAFGVNGAAVADLLTSLVAVTAMLALQSWIRKSFDETHRGPLARVTGVVRSRLPGSAEFITVPSPPPRSAALSPASESLTTPQPTTTHQSPSTP